jgi:hypothetical protein
MISTPDELGHHRDHLLERAVACLQDDERIVAAWLGGSLGRNQHDVWSDIDLVVLVDDGHFDRFWRERGTLFDAITPQVLRQQPIPGNAALPGGNFQLVIFSGPIEIDWTIAPAGNARRSAETRLLFERRPIPLAEPAQVDPGEPQAANQLEFFWAMAPVAVKYAARHDMLNAAGMIATLRRSVSAIAIHPKLERLTKQIALVEIQRLCAEAAMLDTDRRFADIANEVNQLIMLAISDDHHDHG